MSIRNMFRRMNQSTSRRISEKSAQSARRRQKRTLRMERLEERMVLSGGSIAGFVFHDLDGSGSQDGGETGIGGATVFLDTNQNGALDGGEVSTSTLADGSYEFAGLAPGDYTVAQVLPSGWLQTAANSPGVGRMGEVIHSIPNAGTSTPSGMAWVNGELYQLESLAGTNKIWRLDPSTGAVLGSFDAPADVLKISFDGTNLWGTGASTNALVSDKIYHFTPDGTLLHTFDGPGGLLRGLACDGNHVWAIRSASTQTNLDARIFELDASNLDVTQLPVVSSFASPTTIHRGLTFDGQHLWLVGGSQSETRELMQIDRVTGQVVQTIDDLPFSTQVVSERETKTGYIFGPAFDGHALWYADIGIPGTGEGLRLVQVDPGGDHRAVTVVDDATSQAAAIGNSQVATISGRVFYDANQDGDWDPGEQGIAGRQVFLDHDANGQLDTAETVAVTDADGNYQFAGRFGQTYHVTQILPPVNWEQVGPAGSHQVSVTASGQIASGLDFADYLNRIEPLATDWVTADGGPKNLYTGLVWQDLSGANRGTFDEAQAAAAADTKNGYDDWRTPTVNEAQLAAQSGVGQLNVISTGGSDWAFWTSTSFNSTQAWFVQLFNPTGLASTNFKTRIFQLAMVRDAGANLDDGSAGYVDTGWTSVSNSAAHGGDYRSRAAGSGSHTATWTFTGLEPGASYKIGTSWIAAAGNASNAGYAVRDGGNLEGTVLVNQKVAANDFEVGGTMWEGLGTYTMDSGTLTVTLSDLANGTVLADAIRLFKVYDSFLPPQPAVIVSPTSGLTTTEAGGTAEFSVVLGLAPTADVTIAVATSDAGEGTANTSLLTFTPTNWATPQVVTVTGVDDAAPDGDVAYTIVLAAAASADPGYDGLAVADVQVVNDDDDLVTKFFVVDDGTANNTYEYSANGTAVENYGLAAGNTTPTGAASNVAGDTVWVIDNNRTMYVYNASGGLLGSWTAGTLASNAQPQGVTVSGNDLWIVDAKSDKVFKYTGAATRLSGSQNAASSFNLNSGNGAPTDIVTDGASFWVTNDASQNRVYKYTLAGSHQGNWRIDNANSTPTGITLDPSAVGTLWIVDSGTDKIYEYQSAASRTSGGPIAANAAYNLASGNTNPQGIADPPTGGGETLQDTPADDQPGDRRRERREARRREAAFATPFGNDSVGSASLALAQQASETAKSISKKAREAAFAQGDFWRW